MKSPFAGMFGGGGGVGNPGTGQTPQSNAAPAIDEPEEVIEEEPNSIFGELFNEDEEDDDSNEPDDEDDDPDDEDDESKKKKKKTPKGEGPEVALAKEIQTTLSKMSIPEEMIPDDFDPTDKKQLRELLAKVQQQTSLATIQLAFKPMQLAIKNLTEEMHTTVRNAIAEHGGNTTARTVLESVVPEVNDPELKGLVGTLFKQAQKKTKKPAEAAASVRKALDAMGIKSKMAKKGSNNQDPSGSAYREGKDALDLYGPLPVKKAAKA